MAKLIFADDIPAGWACVNREVLKHGNLRPSERGQIKSLPNVLLVIKDSTPDESMIDPSWELEGGKGGKETYSDRINQFGQFEAGCKLISKFPYSRRFSISVGRPWDARSKTPPALYEIYVQVIRSFVHLTAFFRSVDAFNYLSSNLAFISKIQDSICERTKYGKGTIAAFIANLHLYSRDEERIGDIVVPCQSSGDGAKLIAERHIPFGWRRTIEYILKEGIEDRTEWGAVFRKQSRAKFSHRMLIDISDPVEEMIDESSMFSAKYGEEYAIQYIIGTRLDREARRKDIMRSKGEAYTYASRARVEPIDQLHLAVRLLRNKPYTRRAAVIISRPWDLYLRYPPCLRAYVLHALDDETLGLTLFMRSNDAYGATYANQYAFTRLAQSVGAESGFTRVKMTLLSANMHIYEDSWKAVEKVINPEMPSARDRLGI